MIVINTLALVITQVPNNTVLDSIILLIYGMILVVATYYAFRYEYVDRYILFSLLIILGRGYFLYRLFDVIGMHNEALLLDSSLYRLPFILIAAGLLIYAIYRTVKHNKKYK